MSEALSVRELLALPGGTDRIVWTSGDATLDTIGGVDWTNHEAFSLPVGPFHDALVQFVKDSLGHEANTDPRGVSLPDEVEEEDGNFMVALTELLTVVVLAAHQSAR